MSIAARCTCDKYLTFCDGNCKSPEVTPDMLDRLKSVIGEQPMKEVLPIGHAETFLKDRYKKQFVKDLPAISGYSLPGLLEAYINELKQQGYTLTKK